jgi:High potential iron-sulfur protein
MEITPQSRRDFLKRLSAAGALGLGAGTVLSACGGGETAEQTAAAPAAPAPAAAASGCMDTSGLTEQEVGMRGSLQYVDVSPQEGKDCANCSLYLAAAEGAACGGCNLLKGPIAAEGFCISWAPAQV